MPRMLRPDSSRTKQGRGKRCAKGAARSHRRVPDRCRRGDGPFYTRPTVTPAAPTPATSADGVIDAAAVRAALARCRGIVERHAAYLTRLDAVLGDGDHGDNLVIGFRAVDEQLAQLADDTPPGELLRAVGHRLVATVGGASGPLYGTAFLEAGARIGDAPAVTAGQVAAMLEAAAWAWPGAADAPPATRRSSTRWPLPRRCSGARSRRVSPPDAYGVAVRRRRAGCGPRGRWSPAAGWPCGSGTGRSGTWTRGPSRACSCCARSAATDTLVLDDRGALLAQIDALERERRRSFDEAQREADALFAQYQLSQLIASGGSLADLAASVLAELVRLAAAAAGRCGWARWAGCPRRRSP